MRVALAQINSHIGNFESNTAKICDLVNRAKKEDVSLVIFPELAVCGYPPLDFLDYHHFTEECNNAISRIAEACTGIIAIVGAPSFNPVLKGKNLYNSAYVLGNGKILNV